MTAVGALWARARQALRGSMTAQIWLAITLMATVLVAGSSALVLNLSKQGLGDVADVILMANLANLQQELTDEHLLDHGAARALANRFESQLGNLHVALLDDHRQLIASSDGFAVPLSLLPAEPFSAVLLPHRITTDQARRLQRQLADAAPEGGLRLTHQVTTDDGIVYRLMLGSVALPAQAIGAPENVLVVLALDATPARQLARQSWTVIAAALLLSTAVAGVVGNLLARRIVVVARRLGGAAGRIGANAMGERLDVRELPLELRDTGEAFNRMLDRLEAAFTRLTELTADMAHDLRTPINNLMGEAQVALSRPRTASEYRGVLESAVEDYERLTRLIENMLFLARTDGTDARLQREWIDARAFTVRVQDYFEPLAEERGLTLACTCVADGDPAPRLWADRMLLIRAVGNLMDNALRYASPGSPVTLTLTTSAHGAARLTVANHGPVIPEALHRKIFERLFRGDPARERSSEGSGLGLAIVKSVMDLHAGTASVRSAPGEPTAFTLWFPPAALGDAAVPPEPVSVPASVEAPASHP